MAVAILEHDDVEDFECREGEGPDSVLDNEGPTRVANFRVSGHYTCYRRVFSASEREPYIGRALTAQASEAKRVALSVKHAMAGKSAGPIAVTVEGVEEVELKEKILAIYRNELVAALGPGHVLRGAGEFVESSAPHLAVQVRRVDLAEKMTRVRLLIPNAHGDSRWQEI